VTGLDVLSRCREGLPGWALCAAVLALTVFCGRDRAGANPGAAADSDPAAFLVVIVNEKNPIASLSITELRRIVTGELTTWPHGGRITLVLREPGSPDRIDLLRQCCRTTDADYDRLLILASFRGESAFSPRVVSSTISIGKFVFSVPGGVGVVPASEVPRSVKVVRIGGLLPGDSGYPLQRRP
jgi:hypothetical protein